MKMIGINGVCVKESEAVVSVLDHGFLYGIGLFETFRTYQGHPFLLREHLARLTHSCLELGIRYKPDQEAIHRHISELLEANQLTDAYIRISISAGVQPLGLPQEDYTTPTVIVYVKELPPAGPPHGKPLQLLKLRRNTPDSTYRMKSFHYMNNILAKREMVHYPWAAGAEGLFLDGQGFLAEGIVSNLFLIKQERLCTPSLATGILPGITRGHILQLARSMNLPVEEGLYTMDHLTQAEELFVTNSIQEIIPIHTVYSTEGQVLWSGEPGIMTSTLQQAYKQSIKDETQ